MLIVEDDPGISAQLARGLGAHGYDVRSVTTGAAALTAQVPDMVLLDLGLPDIDGAAVCRALRERCDVPIVVISARGEEPDRVQLLDLGADDYLIKPFGFAELTARLRAVLRRSLPEVDGVYRHAGLTVDTGARRVRVKGHEVALTPREFDILAALVVDPGRLVTREEIFSRVWDEHWYGPTKALDVHVASLRRKLGDPGLVETVYGRGFRLRARQ